MYRIFLIMVWSLMASSAVVAADSSRLEPKPGQWSTVVAIIDDSKNHYLLRTTVNDDPVACLTQLELVGPKVKEANGLVYTNTDRNVISYEKKAGYAELGVKVLELGCVLEPFTPGYVSFFF